MTHTHTHTHAHTYICMYGLFFSSETSTYRAASKILADWHMKTKICVKSVLPSYAINIKIASRVHGSKGNLLLIAYITPNVESGLFRRQ